MGFRITGLRADQFESLFGLPESALQARGVVRRVADQKPGFPCRVSLQDAEPGESVLLLNYEHQTANTPFRASHAIYIREGVREAFDAADQIPEVMRTRILSLRAFSSDGMLVEADLADGADRTNGGALETAIERLLANPATAYLHAHYAKPGCFAARIERA